MTVRNPILYHSTGTSFFLDFCGDPPLEDPDPDNFLELLGDAMPLRTYQGAFPASRVPGVAFMSILPGLTLLPFVYVQPLLFILEGGVLAGPAAPGVETYWVSLP